MVFQEPMRRRWPDACENTFEMIADESPDGGWVQLLRSANHPALKPGGDTHQGIARLAKFGMQSGQRDRRLARVFRPASDRGHQPRATSDRLAARVRARQAHEWLEASPQAPPVVDERHRAGGKLAAMQVVRGEPTPAPLVLQLAGWPNRT